ncbi:hypothetical protein [Vallitalea maricola]|uniref:Uncharacterized protein n=1 Tax=Vallitalea maricola TaxID=3074433 RepID=A0ACB5UJK7_9FIRM|nr:hypothetical protein AN2V17_22800 [Vallitalea sp. AN17-2]
MKKYIFIGVAFFILLLITMFFVTNRKVINKDNEVIMIREENDDSTVLLKYYPENNYIVENRVYFSNPNYNANKKENMVVVKKVGDIDEIWEITQYKDTDSSFKDIRKIYTGENISNPKFIPNKDVISFIKDNYLYVLDINQNEESKVLNITLEDYEWMDDVNVLYTEKSSDDNYNIMKYNIETEEKTLFRTNASEVSLSSNKEFLGYRLGDNKNIVRIESLDAKKVIYEVKNDYDFGKFKVSDDGETLIASIYKLSKSKVVKINCKNNKQKLIIDSVLPSTIDWKYVK